MPPCIVIGAGGHAKVVADALMCAGHEVLGFTAPESRGEAGRRVLGTLRLLGGDEVLEQHQPGQLMLANGIGGVDCSGLRRRVQTRLEAGGWRFTEVRHPSATVSPFAELGEATQLLAGCIVQAGARIGRGSIVNTGAIVEHDVELGEFVHVAPGALACGDVRVGGQSHLGAGAIIRQGLQLGEATLVGAGAVVIRDFEGRGTLWGVPAVCGDRQG